MIRIERRDISNSVSCHPAHLVVLLARWKFSSNFFFFFLPFLAFFASCDSEAIATRVKSEIDNQIDKANKEINNATCELKILRGFVERGGIGARWSN